ncbi:3-phosphoglycerate dehydrogenase [Advenella kashmirensis W13003]|uniref:3-phosphoglycerate dehydrogenase n=1 Tax=Advenella kashmirensis W13003 TaxID=1424334 RepID=V8QPT4_9BURK|nr:hydroxyacid dehydrogenase [Advenella kashmirensis]ETF01971.1 3-phosphoglycerate dehydrogenase [Advenella kashmirensis W13003]
MSEKVCVVRTNLWIDPVFDQLMTAHDNVELKIIDVQAPPSEWHRTLSQAHYYHVSAAKDELPKGLFVTEALLEQCPKLQAVSSSGAGYDTIDVSACKARNITVVNQAGGNANSVAEMALGLVLAVSRRIVESDRVLVAQQASSREALMGHEVAGKTLGLVGIGHIGTRFAHIAAALGMKVLAYDPYLTDQDILLRQAKPVSLAVLLAECDIISLHCPLNQDTRELFNADAFGAMKNGAIFVSTARGGIHNEDDLYASLQSGHLAGAGLDVWTQEPPGPDNRLLGHPNVVSTFHTAGVSHEGRHNVAKMAAQQILLMVDGKPPLHVVQS